MRQQITDEQANELGLREPKTVIMQCPLSPPGYVGVEKDILDGLLADRTEMLGEIERLKEFEPKLNLPLDPTDMTVRFAKGFLAQLVASFDALNREANYTTTEVRTSGNDRVYEVVVRRKDKPTDHELRKNAEAENERLRSALKAICRGDYDNAHSTKGAADYAALILEKQ